MEDLLTSNVFGSIEYVPLNQGLELILEQTEMENGEHPITRIAPGSPVKYEFWPQVREADCKFCEPDVLISFETLEGRPILLLVEAKYRSEKSSSPDREIAPNDQLAREWDNLVVMAEKTKSIPLLLYTTAHLGFPSSDVKESVDEFICKRPSKQRVNVLWISWRRIQEVFSSSQYELLRDVAKILERLGLIFFKGIRTVNSIDIDWSFEIDKPKLFHKTAPTSFKWRYHTNKYTRFWSNLRDNPAHKWRFEKIVR